jgi:hypothetical protein
MTAEQLWDKKGPIGLVAVILFFASGILFLGTMKEERRAWGRVEAMKERAGETKWEILVRNGPDGPRLFREVISDPSGRLAPLANKKRKSEFGVRIAQDGDGNWRIVEVASEEEE